MKYLIAIGLILLVGSMVLAVRRETKTTQQAETALQKPAEEFRFQKVESFLFSSDGYATRRATIYEDKKTGVKYLYIWGGGTYGGPAITRLWDK